MNACTWGACIASTNTDARCCPVGRFAWPSSPCPSQATDSNWTPCACRGPFEAAPDDAYWSDDSWFNNPPVIVPRTGRTACRMCRSPCRLLSDARLQNLTRPLWTVARDCIDDGQREISHVLGQCQPLADFVAGTAGEEERDHGVSQSLLACGWFRLRP